MHTEFKTKANGLECGKKLVPLIYDTNRWSISRYILIYLLSQQAL